MIRIEKVKQSTARNSISVDFSKVNKTGERDTFSFTCHDQATKSFGNAFAALQDHVMKLLELPKAYADGVQVNGVSFTYHGDEQIMGATIMATKELKRSNSPFCMNTPHMLSETMGEITEDSRVMEPKCAKALKLVQDETRKYVEGQRAQMELDFGTVTAKEQEKHDKGLVKDAVEIIMETKRASAAAFSRRLKLSAEETARLMDRLVTDGILGEVQDGGCREILLDIEEAA